MLIRKMVLRNSELNCDVQKVLDYNPNAASKSHILSNYSSQPCQILVNLAILMYRLIRVREQLLYTKYGWQFKVPL